MDKFRVFICLQNGNVGINVKTFPPDVHEKECGDHIVSNPKSHVLV